MYAHEVKAKKEFIALLLTVMTLLVVLTNSIAGAGAFFAIFVTLCLFYWFLLDSDLLDPEERIRNNRLSSFIDSLMPSLWLIIILFLAIIPGLIIGIIIKIEIGRLDLALEYCYVTAAILFFILIPTNWVWGTISALRQLKSNCFPKNP